MSIQKYYQALSLQDRISLQNETGLKKWQPLYKTTGIAAIVMLVLISVQIAVFILWPTPKTVLAWFQLFQGNWILGLMHLDFLYIINNTIVVFMYLAFYLSLKEKNESLMLIALVCGMLATAAYYASNPAFDMLSLSRQFSLSATEPEKAACLAAGQTLIMQWKGTAFDIYYILSALCLIIIACIMYASSIYGKRMAAIGFASGMLMLIPSTAGTLGLYFALASLVPWVVFSWLAAVRFLYLGSIKVSSSIIA
jgi:hypothetical protein